MNNKIVCVGDSITKGKVWNENDRRPHITDRSYPILLEGLMGIDVINNGICDITSEKMLQHFETDIKFEENNLVIVEIGGNDCNPNWREIKKNPKAEHEAAISIDGFKSNLLKIIDMVKLSKDIPVLCTLPPLDAEKYYNLLKRVFGESIKDWIDNRGGIYKHQEKYSELIKNIASITGTYLIDIRKAFIDTGNYKKLISFDGIHPNEDGYYLIASTCSEYLKSNFKYGISDISYSI